MSRACPSRTIAWSTSPERASAGSCVRTTWSAGREGATETWPRPRGRSPRRYASEAGRGQLDRLSGKHALAAEVAAEELVAGRGVKHVAVLAAEDEARRHGGRRRGERCVQAAGLIEDLDAE